MVLRYFADFSFKAIFFKRTKMKKTTFLYIILSISLASCIKDKNDVDIPSASFSVPMNFPAPVYNFDKNPITNAGFALGKKLFYDGRLSRDGSISCGDCHQQSAGFAHADHRVSHGVDNQLGTRNSPALFNLAWQNTFFWDGGVHDLDLFSISPIENPIEMDEKMPNVIKKLQSDNSYPSMFQNAFGTNEINGTRTFQALSQFMNMLVSSNSKYDRYKRGEAAIILSSDELSGLALVQEKCQSCHKGELFSDFSFRNNGVGAGKDVGRALITLNQEDNYKFKVPSLRNLGYSSPYMHNGRFLNLDAVLNHYSNEIKGSPTLDVALQNGNVNGIVLTEKEKKDIIAFLNTLNDETFIKDKRFSEF